MALGVIIKGTGGFLLDPAGDTLILWVNNQLHAWCWKQGYSFYDQRTLQGLMTAEKRHDPPYKVDQKHLSYQAVQVSEESFKVERTGERVNNQQSSEEMVDQVGKQRVQGDVDWSILVIKKTRLKGIHSKHMHKNKGVPIRKDSITGKVLVSFLGNKHSRVPLWSARTLTHATWGTNEEFEVSVQLQGYELITEVC